MSENRVQKKISREARPEHPGAVLRLLYWPGTGLTQQELADELHVSRRSVNMIFNEQKPVTIDMANRLARFFGTSAQFWMNMQLALDIWDAMQKHQQEYRTIKSLSELSAEPKARRRSTVTA